MRKTAIITVSASAMQQLVTGYDKGERLAHSIIAQMLIGANGAIGYLQMGVPKGTNADKAQAIQLAPATATVPGLIFQYESHDPAWGDRIDLSEIWLDGEHAGDKILVSWWEMSK